MDPLKTPQISPDEIEKIISDHRLQSCAVVLVGIRGHFGGGNKRGIYDDLLVWKTFSAFGAFNANCDPEFFRKNIATLKPGVWEYRPGRHNSETFGQYDAFVQAKPVTVERDGVGEQTGMFGINIHRGSFNSVSSLGCQTVHPDQWEHFRALGYAELKRYGMYRFPYILVEA